MKLNLLTIYALSIITFTATHAVDQHQTVVMRSKHPRAQMLLQPKMPPRIIPPQPIQNSSGQDAPRDNFRLSVGLLRSYLERGQITLDLADKTSPTYKTVQYCLDEGNVRALAFLLPYIQDLSHFLMSTIEKGEVREVSTLLHAAAWSEYHDIIEQPCDPFGNTPLHYCHTAKKNSPKIAELLLQHGASCDARNDLGLTPLHTLFRWNNAPRFTQETLEHCKALLNYGANPLEQANDCSTPLREARTRIETLRQDVPATSSLRYDPQLLRTMREHSGLRRKKPKRKTKKRHGSSKNVRFADEECICIQ